MERFMSRKKKDDTLVTGVDTRPWEVTNGSGDNRRCWYESTADDLVNILGPDYKKVKL
jgi:hypothetical protein